MTSKVEYLGELRTKNTHSRSGDHYITDAPVDNHGKGEAFSPTDTVATALGNCILTTLGIKLGTKDPEIVGATVDITKTMAAHPRRIAQIEALVHFPKDYDQKTKNILEHTARHCPVINSLHPDIELKISFTYKN